MPLATPSIRSFVSSRSPSAPWPIAARTSRQSA